MSEWLSIETAPKMRTILLWAQTSTDPPNWKMATGFLREGYLGEPDVWEWDGRRVEVWEHKPSHWQALPAPPAETEK